MRSLIKPFLVTITACTLFACTATKKSGTIYTGKLQVKALCMNYTLSVTQGAIDPSLVVASYTDETTKKTFTNAFGLSNPCNFPASIKEGDEFKFVIDTAGRKDCAVCMAYYPTPEKKLSIRIIE